jgi:hypothetical protein
VRDRLHSTAYELVVARPAYRQRQERRPAAGQI